LRLGSRDAVALLQTSHVVPLHWHGEVSWPPHVALAWEPFRQLRSWPSWKKDAWLVDNYGENGYVYMQVAHVKHGLHNAGLSSFDSAGLITWQCTALCRSLQVLCVIPICSCDKLEARSVLHMSAEPYLNSFVLEKLPYLTARMSRDVPTPENIAPNIPTYGTHVSNENVTMLCQSGRATLQACLSADNSH